MNQGYNRASAFRGEKPLTDLSVEDLFLSVANWFNDLEKGLEESEVTQSPGLIIELLPLCFLQSGKKNRGCVFKLFHFLFSCKAKVNCYKS